MIEVGEAAPAPYRQDRAPWGWRDLGIVLFITLVAVVAIFTALGGILRLLDIDGDLDDSPTASAVLIIGQIVLDLAAVGAAAAFSIGKYGLRPAAWGVVWPPQLRVGLVFLALFIAYLSLGLYSGVTRALGLDALEPESNVPQALFDSPWVVPLAVLLIAVVAPIAEEMFFRGFLFHGLWGRLGFWPAAISSGLLFSLIHVSSSDLIGLIVPFTIIGVVFAWLVRRTGSLWNAIAAHFLFNSFSLTVNLIQRWS